MVRSPLLDIEGMGEVRFKKFKKAFPKGIGDADAAERFFPGKIRGGEAVNAAAFHFRRGGGQQQCCAAKGGQHR
jgi:hypothetical protein